MANSAAQLLAVWSTQKDTIKWVLATIIETDGSSYRKAGAMMLINDLGQYFGLLSGGCLESDIMRQARRCWDNGKNRIIEYDMREEEDLAWQLGIGCGGMVKILLQAVDSTNDYLSLEQLHQHLLKRRHVYYRQTVDENFPKNTLIKESEVDQFTPGLVSLNSDTSFNHRLSPPPLIAVFGGGVDAKPVVAIAFEMGWQVVLIDPRVGYAKIEHFPTALSIERGAIETLASKAWLQQISLAFVLTHNIKLDGQAVALLQNSSVHYVGLLGPKHRTERVLDTAGLSLQELQKPLANPVGLKLGGELPESIALSMLAEAHGYLEGGNGVSFSGLIG